MSGIYEQAKKTMDEVRQNADLTIGKLLVVGCSTSTVHGEYPGADSSEDVAEELYRALTEVFGAGFDIAVQCCEH